MARLSDESLDNLRENFVTTRRLFFGEYERANSGVGFCNWFPAFVPAGNEVAQETSHLTFIV